MRLPMTPDWLMTTTTLEAVMGLTALACVLTAGYCLGGSIYRRRAFQRDGLNGLRMLTATANVIRDAIRLLSSTVLAVAAGLLLSLPSDLDPAALVAKHTLMVLGWCLLSNTLSDALMRRKIMHAIEAYETRNGDA